ncbi:MAG: CAP domain-containing protein [Kofleriaceae bacterium]
MKTLAIVLVAACGPIYPASNQTQAPPPREPVSSSGPPGGAMDPYAPATSPEAALPPTETPPPTEMSAPKPPARPTSKLPPHAETFITEHNRYRAMHCAGPLTWSPQLAADAQKWADTLEAKGCVFGHSGGKHGENLAAGTTGALPPEEVVRMWYDEVKIYDFKKPTGFSMETGHFTQVVWTDTTQVGCGMAQCKGNDIWVCQYERPGNWEGQYRQKVLPSSCKK